jgi:Family of unknown function (DUF6188)
VKQEHSKHWNAKRFEQKGNRYLFAFSGETVGSIRLGGDIKIYLGDDFLTRIDLWMPFTFAQYGQSHIYNPRETTSLAPLLALVGSKIVKAVAEQNGFLVLEFDNGITLAAPSDQSEHRWEAWQIVDRHGFHVICAIGGSLAIWMPDAESSRRRNKEGNIWFD